MFSFLRRGQCRRLDDVELKKRLRQFSMPRRVSLIIVLLLCLLYFIVFSFISPPHIPESQKCLDERLSAWKSLENDNLIAMSSRKFGFTGNGFIGLGGDGELRFKASSYRVLSIRSAFLPIIDAVIQDSSSYAESHINDYRDGTIITIRCYHMNNQCLCIVRRAYAHRRRPHLLIQELQAANPLGSDIKVKLSVKIPEHWTKKSGTLNSLYSRNFESDGEHILAAATCNGVPEVVIVERRHNIVLRFLCLIDYISPLPLGKRGIDDELKLLDEGITKELKDFSMMVGTVLEREHTTAWEQLNAVTFGISKSLAPNALNAKEINATRYMLLSNTRDPLLEIGVSENEKKAVAASMNKRDVCYTGHSTLLVPSRLWRKSDNIDEIIETVDIWLLTLEKRGCSGLLKAGASGLAEAFVLSLLASKFSHEHLEIDIDPADLQREIVVNNLAYSLEKRVTINVHLNADNQPYFMISSNSQIFACDAACLNEPILIGSSKVRIPVKVTKPHTPILYISHDKNHLDQLRGTIHVVEVIDAPAHEHGTIALHKHGHSLGGLPVAFWLMLGALVIVFHLFLFKLLYSEWKKGDTTPYNYYLRQRYLRSL